MKSDIIWLDAVLSEKTTVILNLKGLPSFYKLESGWEIGDSVYDEYLIHYVHDGAFSAYVRGREYVVGGGEMSILAPRTRFRYIGHDGGLSLSRLRMRVYQGRKLVVPEQPFIAGRLSRDGRHQLEHLIHLAEAPGRYARWQVKGVLANVFAELFDDMSGTSEGRGGLSTAQIREVQDYFNRYHSDRPSPSDLAAVAGLSPDYFTRLFRESFGMAPRMWMTEQRVRMAELQLMESTRGVGQISEDLGYPTIFAFSQQFKAFTGRSPSGYRLGGR